VIGEKENAPDTESDFLSDDPAKQRWRAGRKSAASDVLKFAPGLKGLGAGFPRPPGTNERESAHGKSG